MKKFLLSIVALVCAVSLWAVPAYRGWQTRTQADGTTIEVRQVGDEFYHYWESKDGKQVGELKDGTFIVLDEKIPTKEEFMAKRKASKMYASRPRKAIGERNFAPKGLVILVQFPDVSFKAANDATAFDNMLNQEGYNYGGATGSAVDYFKAQSNGAYVPSFDVFGPVTLPNNLVYYGEQDYGDDGVYGTKDDGEHDLYIADFVIDAVTAANDAGCDFSQYDSDGDGYVDIVYFFYAGKGQAAGGNTETIWPHNWELRSALYFKQTHGTSEYYVNANSQGYVTSENLPKFDGKKINNYVCSAELKSNSSRSGIGTLCHEFSHVLGLPDYYDTEYGENDENGVTPYTWSIMDMGSYNNNEMTPPNYSIYDKYFMGWATPKFLAKNAQLDVTITTDYDDAYQITGGSSSVDYNNTGTVYYIENRQQSGWDAYLPGHGMIVWQVKYNADVWSENAPNNTAGNPRYTIVPADGKTSNYGQASDAFPRSNVTSYTPFTGCALTQITETNNNISFKYNGGAVNYWTYGLEGTNCSVPADGQIDKGKALNLTITPNAGYTLADEECWAVEMGSDLLEYGTGFTYNEGTGAFSIASVTGNVYIIATAKEVPATITWMDKGVEFTTTQTSAGKLVLPADEPDACESKVFVGWGKSVISTPTDEAPALVKDGDDADQTTYYAVFATEEEGSEPTTITERMKTTSPYVALTGWTTNASDTYTSSGNYGASSPSLKLTATGQYIQSALMESAITAVSYWYKSQGASGSSIDFYVSTDGSSFTKLAGETVTLGSSSGTKSITLNANDGYKAIKLVYQRSSGNLAIDDVSITYGGTSYSEYTTSCTTPENVTVTFNENGGEGTMEAQTVPYNTATALNANEFTKVGHTFAGWATTADGEVVYADEAEVTLKKNITLFAKWSINKYKINKAEVSNGTISTSPVDSAIYGATVTITATPNTHYTLGGISVVDVNEQAVELTGNTFAMPASNVTVSAIFNEKATHTIRFFDNGVQVGESQAVHLDDTPEVPEDRTPCDQDEYTFVGWAKAAITTETTDAPTIVDDYTVTGDQDYYAVYSRTEEGEGTGTFDGKTAGTYKIYAQVGETKYYAQGTGSKISSTTNEANATEYTFEAVTSGFAIKTGTTYITYSSSTDLGTSNNAYTWTFASGTKGTWRANSSTSGRGWIFRAGSTNKFGGYSTGNITADGDYYDLEISGGASSTTYYTTAPDCSAEVYTISLNAGENGSLASSHESAKAGKTITITITPNEFFHLDTITANDGAVTLSGTGNTRTFTMPASDVTVAATFAEDDKYTVRFISEGEAISTQALHLGELAQKPADPTASCDDYTFEGWWTAELEADNEEEKSWVSDFTVTGDQDYYAIFSKTEEGGLDSLTLTQGPTSGSGYNINYSTTENTAQGNTIYIASNNILNGSSSIQIKAGATNRIYNTSAMPGNITKITVTATTNSANVYVGSSSVASGSSALTPTSGSASSTAVYTIASGNTYFAVGATSSYVIVSSIIVTFSSSTTYYTSTVSCGTTSVEDVQSDDVQCTKVLKDGQIYLMYKGTMYDVQGRRVK